MGFKLPERTARINFEGTDWDGAEVVVTLQAPLGFYRRVTQSAGGIDEMVDVLSQLVKEWNIDDEDGPIPPTAEGLDRIRDMGFLKAILDGWVSAMTAETSVSVPLDETSSNGDGSTSTTQLIAHPV